MKKKYRRICSHSQTCFLLLLHHLQWNSQSVRCPTIFKIKIRVFLLFSFPFFLFVICACVLWFFFPLLHPVTTQWLIPKFSGGQPSGYQTSVVLLKRRCQTANWKRSPGCSTDKRDPWCAIPPLIPLKPFSGSWDETTTAAEHVPDCWRVRQALLKTVGARRKMRGKAFASLFRCWKADLGRKEFLHALT